MVGFPRAPTAAIDDGQRSRISRIRGTRRNRLTQTPAQPQKNCGEVAMAMSGLSTLQLARMAENMKDR